MSTPPYAFNQTRVANLGLNLQVDRVESERLQRYKVFWSYYLGSHWAVSPADGEPQITVNYSQFIVDSAWYYLLFQAPKISRRTREGEDKSQTGKILDFLSEVWEDHNDDLVARLEFGLVAGITGDAFILVTSMETDEFGRRLPEDQRRIIISTHDSQLAFPRFKNRPTGELREIELWHPYIVDIEDDFPDRISTVKQDPVHKREVHIFREVISADEIKEYLDDIEITQPTVMHGIRFAGTRSNPLGVINVVHLKNKILPRENYGQSDIFVQTALNADLNVQLSDVSDILRYNAAPVTIVQGARISNMEKGADKVWSNLPEKGKVYNLEMASDLAGSHSFVNELRSSMLEVAKIPEIVTGRNPPGANMSGTAMAMLYQPIIEMCGRKSPGYRRAYKQINELIMRIGEQRYGLKVSRRGVAKYKTDVAFQKSIPRDRMEELQVFEKEAMLRVNSRERYWEERGVDDVEELEKQIDKEMKDGILPEEFNANPGGGQVPPPSGNDTKGPKNPKAGTGRPSQPGSRSSEK
jgi:hypothetical protein